MYIYNCMQNWDHTEEVMRSSRVWIVENTEGGSYAVWTTKGTWPCVCVCWIVQTCFDLFCIVRCLYISRTLHCPGPVYTACTCVKWSDRMWAPSISCSKSLLLNDLQLFLMYKSIYTQSQCNRRQDCISTSCTRTAEDGPSQGCMWLYSW